MAIRYDRSRDALLNALATKMSWNKYHPGHAEGELILEHVIFNGKQYDELDIRVDLEGNTIVIEESGEHIGTLYYIIKIISNCN